MSSFERRLSDIGKGAMESNFRPSIEQESKSDPTMTNEATMQDDVLGGFSVGVVQFAEGTQKNPINNVTKYLTESRYKEDFKGMDPDTSAGRSAIKSTLKSIAAREGNEALIQDQLEVAETLPTVKQAKRIASEISNDIPADLKGYIHGLGLNIGTPSTQRKIIEDPLKRFEAGEISEMEAIQEMALKRVDVNIANGLSVGGLLERNFQEPLRHMGLLDKGQSLTIANGLKSKNKHIREWARKVDRQMKKATQARAQKQRVTESIHGVLTNRLKRGR